MSASTKQREPHRVVSIVVNTLLVIGIVLAVSIIVPALLGYHRFVIDGHSMETAIPYGSVVFDEEVPVEELRVGDVITFTPPPEYDVTKPVTHRIVSIQKGPGGENVYRTKGDNNDSEDPWTFTLDQSTQARVAFHVPYVGYIYIWLSIWWVRILVFVVPAIGAVIWLVASLWREAGRDVQRERLRSRAVS